MLAIPLSFNDQTYNYPFIYLKKINICFILSISWWYFWGIK